MRIALFNDTGRRHHGVCLAALAGVPFVAMGSSTWKIEGMLTTFDRVGTRRSPSPGR